MNKKAAYVISNLEIGGAELQTLNHINYLDDHGYDVYLIILSSNVSLLKRVKLPQDRVLVIDNDLGVYGTRSIRNLLGHQSTILQFIRKNKIKVLVGVMNLAHVICRLLKIQYFFKYQTRLNLIIYHRNAFYIINKRDTLTKYVFDRLNIFLSYILDNRTIFISASVKENISKHSMKLPHPFIIPNSVVDRKVSRKHADNLYGKLGISSSEYKILIPGRLHPQKGHQLFLLAFSDFVKKNELRQEKVQVVIAGMGAERKSLEEIISQENLDRFVKFSGQLENEVLLSVMKFSNLVVVPSLYEGFGNVAVEVLMVSGQLLCSRVGGLADIVEHGKNGFLFEPGNKEDLRVKLNWLFDNRNQPLLSKQEVRESYLKKFTIESQMEKLIPIIYNW